MKATLNWKDGLEFDGRADSDHHVTIDGPPDLGGKNAGFRPMEMMLLSVGGCSAMDVMHILKKSRQDVTDCRIEVDGTRAETEPKVFTDIHVQFIVSGRNLSDKHVARAVELSAEKYCSASIMLAQAVNMTHGYTIHEAE
ncbi:OsmC family protein [Salinisphaera sp. LB1]|uniref:OsmC family protein n=1 Tax=Salinisphaera sp. LB1 TaxID=2183911 RepID=UPI000D707360|nr:OsmC family protein [Salinisphaera sp. LB1]AWN16138.1 OsmC/Ohr family protein [Salinisphaera sp. LB1]